MAGKILPTLGNSTIAVNISSIPFFEKRITFTNSLFPVRLVTFFSSEKIVLVSSKTFLFKPFDKKSFYPGHLHKVSFNVVYLEELQNLGTACWPCAFYCDLLTVWNRKIGRHIMCKGMQWSSVQAIVFLLWPGATKQEASLERTQPTKA